MLSSWNGVFAAKSRWGVNELWGLWNLGDLLTFIKKSLFVNNSHTFLYFTYFFLGNDTLNNELKFYWKKEKSTDVAPRRFEVTLIDRLGPNILRTLWMEGQVLHCAQAHLKVPGWSLVWNVAFEWNEWRLRKNSTSLWFILE